MAVRTIYAHEPDMKGRPTFNQHGCSVAIGTADDGLLAVSVYGFGGEEANEQGHGAFAVIDRDEARAIYEALGRELADG
ncbi:hypothetical protein [Devosia ginsengisoli]|uniref:hypothetical protein n=1 Tax=Devosia ginsengisoli TaxID=400770 RepID=UPI0026F1C1ED|nr:hypothetical protein [Devosia ginsengisoli]MCR6673259.1 hypothetical protein [Devosia ginsengisoli]